MERKGKRKRRGRWRKRGREDNIPLRTAAEQTRLQPDWAESILAWKKLSKSKFSSLGLLVKASLIYVNPQNEIQTIPPIDLTKEAPFRGTWSG